MSTYHGRSWSKPPEEGQLDHQGLNEAVEEALGMRLKLLHAHLISHRPETVRRSIGRSILTWCGPVSRLNIAMVTLPAIPTSHPSAANQQARPPARLLLTAPFVTP